MAIWDIVDEIILSTIEIVEVVEVIVEVVEVIVEVIVQWTKVPKNDINNKPIYKKLCSKFCIDMETFWHHKWAF